MFKPLLNVSKQVILCISNFKSHDIVTNVIEVSFIPTKNRKCICVISSLVLQTEVLWVMVD